MNDNNSPVMQAALDAVARMSSGFEHAPSNDDPRQLRFDVWWHEQRRRKATPQPAGRLGDFENGKGSY